MELKTSPKVGPVLVAVDLGEASAEALQQGNRIARAWRVPLSVCHVSKRARGRYERGTSATGWSAARDRLEQAQLTDWLVCALGAAQLEVRDLVVESGPVDEGVLRAAGRLAPSLIVLGAGCACRHQRPQAAFVDEIMRLAPTDVLLARPQREGAILAVDFSFDAPAVTAAAIAHARQRDRYVARLSGALARTVAPVGVAAIVNAARLLPADLVVLAPSAALPDRPSGVEAAKQLLRSDCCSVLLVRTTLH